MNSARTVRLDAVRGMAVVSVVVYHVVSLTVFGHRPHGEVGLGWVFLGAGRLGVDAFFVLSGFLLARSWEASRRRHDRRLAAFWEYARKRALRILPAYWLSLVVLVPLVAPGVFDGVSGIARLLLLVSVQAHLDPSLPGEVNLVYWSLTTEVHFYLVLPLVVFVLRRRPRLLLGACLLASVGWRLWAPYHLPDSWLVGRLDQFVVGMLAAGAVAVADGGAPGRVARGLLRPGAGPALVAALGLLAANHGSRFVLAGVEPYSEWTHALVGLVIGGLLVRGALNERAPSPVARAFAGAGVVSYSAYLWHYPILQYGLDTAGLPRAGTPAVATVAALAVLLAVVVGVSRLSYRYVERPFLRSRSDSPPGRSPQVAPEPLPCLGHNMRR